jgi:hypothetical protein
MRKSQALCRNSRHLFNSIIQRNVPFSYKLCKESWESSGCPWMTMAIINQSITSHHNSRICKCHADILFIHNIAYSQALREITAHFCKGLCCTSLAFVFSFCQLTGAVITVIALQPSIIISSCTDSGGKRKIRIAVTGYINAIHTVAIYLTQQLFHLSETAHASYMGHLNRNVV